MQTAWLGWALVIVGFILLGYSWFLGSRLGWGRGIVGLLGAILVGCATMVIPGNKEPLHFVLFGIASFIGLHVSGLTRRQRESEQPNGPV